MRSVTKIIDSETTNITSNMATPASLSRGGLVLRFFTEESSMHSKYRRAGSREQARIGAAKGAGNV